jgi:hypothetical protein
VCGSRCTAPSFCARIQHMVCDPVLVLVHGCLNHLSTLPDHTQARHRLFTRLAHPRPRALSPRVVVDAPAPRLHLTKIHAKAQAHWVPSVHLSALSSPSYPSLRATQPTPIRTRHMRNTMHIIDFQTVRSQFAYASRSGPVSSHHRSSRRQSPPDSHSIRSSDSVL